jgi:hypothetical protein
MQFILTGFTQDTGFRVFAFEGIAGDRSRTVFTVRTDLELSRRYGIRVQELPLLCRGLLELHDEADPQRTMTFTEEGMRLHANHCAAERDAAQKRKSGHRHSTNRAGTSWRVPPQSEELPGMPILK